MTRIMLVRHGESHWNAEHRYQGQQDSGLTDLGREQAERVGHRLLDELGEAAVIWSSDLPRAHDTSAPYARLAGLSVTCDPRLRELDIGTWGGRRLTDVAEEHPAVVEAAARGEDVRRGGGETFAEMRARVTACLSEIVARSGAETETRTVVVFSHGGTIRVAAAHAAGVPSPGHATLGAPTNCSITEIGLTPERAVLRGYNRPLQ